MKVTQFGPGSFPLALASWSTGEFSLNSNSDTFPGLSALNFVQRITANTSNTLLNPIINFAAGSNILLTLDQGPLPTQAMPSNTIRIHSTATGGGSGTLSTVEEVDGTPTDSAVTKLVFPNGTLSIASHVATYTPAATGGGSFVWLQRQTAATSATLDFTSFISSTYDVYVFVIAGLLNATSATDLLMRMGTGGGPSFDSGANYSYENHVYRAGAQAISGGTGQTAIKCNFNTATVSTAQSGIPMHGIVRLYLPSHTTYWKQVNDGILSYWDGSFRVNNLFSGKYESTTAVTGIQFLMSSGNLTSGTIDCYGLTHA